VCHFFREENITFIIAELQYGNRQTPDTFLNRQVCLSDSFSLLNDETLAGNFMIIYDRKDKRAEVLFFR